MEKTRKTTAKQIEAIAKMYGVSAGYVEKAMEKCGVDDDTEYLMRYIEHIYGERKDIKELLTDQTFAPLTKKDIAELSKGYAFLKADVIELARREKAEGKEPTREFMKNLLDEIQAESEEAYEEENA